MDFGGFAKKLAGAAIEHIGELAKEVGKLDVNKDHTRHQQQQQQYSQQEPQNQQQPQQNNVPAQTSATSCATSQQKRPSVAGQVPQPKEQELKDLSAACQKLWELDDNRITVGEKIILNLQGQNRRNDAAQHKFFDKVSKDVWNAPTFKIFYALLDNYDSVTGQKEVVSQEEMKEVSDFLDACLATRVMQYCHKLLIAHRCAPPSVPEFKKLLHGLWFDMYRRGCEADSSGFEHVFVGEHKRGTEVTGLHNWIQFWILEEQGKLDYRGYMQPKCRNARTQVDGDDHIFTVQFAWNGIVKPVTSIIVGSSPEFELALYTLCFLAGREANEVVVAGYRLCIKCHRICGNRIGSVYPELIEELED